MTAFNFPTTNHCGVFDFGFVTNNEHALEFQFYPAKICDDILAKVIRSND